MGTNMIQGYEANSADVEALAANLLAGVMESIEDLPDPLHRYVALCKQQVLQVAARRALESAIVRERGVELRRIAEQGATYDQIAEAVGLGGKQRVSQLIAHAKDPAHASMA